MAKNRFISRLVHGMRGDPFYNLAHWAASKTVHGTANMVQKAFAGKNRPEAKPVKPHDYPEYDEDDVHSAAKAHLEREKFKEKVEMEAERMRTQEFADSLKPKKIKGPVAPGRHTAHAQHYQKQGEAALAKGDHEGAKASFDLARHHRKLARDVGETNEEFTPINNILLEEFQKEFTDEEIEAILSDVNLFEGKYDTVGRRLYKFVNKLSGNRIHKRYVQKHAQWWGKRLSDARAKEDQATDNIDLHSARLNKARGALKRSKKPETIDKHQKTIAAIGPVVKQAKDDQKKYGEQADKAEPAALRWSEKIKQARSGRLMHSDWMSKDAATLPPRSKLFKSIARTGDENWSSSFAGPSGPHQGGKDHMDNWISRRNKAAAAKKIASAAAKKVAGKRKKLTRVNRRDEEIPED